MAVTTRGGLVTDLSRLDARVRALEGRLEDLEVVVVAPVPGGGLAAVSLELSGTMGIGSSPGGTAFTIVNPVDRQMIFLRGVAGQTGWYIRANDSSDDYVFGVSGIGEVYSAKTNGSDLSYIAHIIGDTEIRWGVEADGAMFWGDGTAGPDVRLWRSAANRLNLDDNLQCEGGIYLTEVLDTAAIIMGASSDTNLYRSAANTLKTDDNFIIAGGLYFTGAFDTPAIFFGSSSDTNLYRSAADVLTTDDDFSIKTAGKGLRIKEGTNAKMGTATMNGTTAVVVSTTAVTASSRIFLTYQLGAGTVGAPYVSARTAGTSFSIKSTIAGDTSTCAWMIVEPA